MNLDLDDPLGDLLSEGSNDSFFGIEPSKKAKDKEKSDENLSSGKFGQSNKMESLFGIPSEKAAPARPKTSDYALKSTAEEPSSLTMVKKPSTPPFKAVESAGKMQKKVNDSDITSDLGFDPRKPRKKSNILDELLGIDKAIVPKPRDPSPPIKKSISRQTTSETTSENVNTESGYTPSATRKSGRRQSAVVFSDPLGLFGSSEKEKEIKVSAKARKSIAGPEWLTVDVENTSKLTKIKSSPSIQVTKNSEDRSDSEPVTVASFESKPLLSTISDFPRNPQMMEALASETSSSLQNLKQQEFQLMVASQMKTQENVLLDMKHKQQELLHQQEMQFNDLLKKQIFRQSELEDIIKQQQERINTHIQVLMTSQANAPYMDNRFIPEKPQKTEFADEENPIEKIELEGELKKLEMEKLRLEDLLSNVNDNHEKEIVMIEQSYKKRILMLEDNLQNLENRYKNEIKNMEEFFQRKITSSDLEKQNIIGSFESQLKTMENDRQSTIAKLKINYETDLESLKRHYEEMVENIRKSKLMEFAVGQESVSYMDVLRQASSNLETASGDISSLHEMLQEKMMVLEKDKELQLTNREKKVEDQQKLLERTRDASELERNKLLELIQTLELKLNSIEIRSDEEQWTLRQQLSSLEVERKSFEKEREYQRNQHGVEEKRVAELKQIQLSEFSKLMQQVDIEKAKIQEEKVQLEVAKQLNGQHSRSEISRAEIDAGVKFAEDAANQSDRERQRLIELQRQCETKKRGMIDQENLLRSKQTELETAINRAKAKERAAESLIQNVKKTELSLVAKYQSLQKYAAEMSDRESKIANQKIELSKERLELQSLRRKLYDSRCSLCKIGDQTSELKSIIQRDPNDFDNIGNNISSDPLRRFEVSGAITDQLLNGSTNAQSSESMEDFFKQDINVDLDGVPNLTDMSDDLLDSDLLLLKFNVLNFKNDNKFTEF